MADRKGRKYLVMNADKWEEFKSQFGETMFESLGAAQNEADRLATEAEAENSGVAHLFAIVEEAGILETEVQTKVKRNFSSSRTIVRSAKTDSNESGELSGDDSEESTSTEPRKRGGRKSRNTETAE
jgi:hypothetical protein